MKDSVTACFFICFFPTFLSVSLQLPKNSFKFQAPGPTSEGSETPWRQVEPAGQFQPGVAEVGKNSGNAKLHQKLRRQPPLTQDLRLDHQSKMATNCGQVFKEMMMISC